MKNVVLTVLLTSLPVALSVPTTAAAVSVRKAQMARQLPRTAVLRISKRDHSHVEIANLNRHVTPGKRLTHLAFEHVALNAENHGITKLSPKNELDGTSSKSSFGFALRGYYSGYHGAYDAAFNQGYYGGGYYNLPQVYLPTYNYGGYQYGYHQYWGFEDQENIYAYCDPGFQLPYGDAGDDEAPAFGDAGYPGSY